MKSFILRAVLALTAVAGLSACTGMGNYDPYRALGDRVSARAAVNNDVVVTSVGNLRCPTGMRPVQDNAEVVSRADIEYRESHGDRRGGDWDGNRRGGRSPYATYNGARVQVEAEASASGERRVTCQIDLTPAQPQQR